MQATSMLPRWRLCVCFAPAMLSLMLRVRFAPALPSLMLCMRSAPALPSPMLRVLMLPCGHTGLFGTSHMCLPFFVHSLPIH